MFVIVMLGKSHAARSSARLRIVPCDAQDGPVCLATVPLTMYLTAEGMVTPTRTLASQSMYQRLTLSDPRLEVQRGKGVKKLPGSFLYIFSIL